MKFISLPKHRRNSRSRMARHLCKANVVRRAVVEGLERRQLLSAAYSVTLLGPPGVEVIPQAINDNGEVAGYFLTPARTFDAFTEQAGNFTDLGTLGGQSIATIVAINDAGQIAGTTLSAPPYIASSGTTPFLYSGGQVIDLDTFPGAVATVVAMNRSGQVIFDSNVAFGNDNSHGFVYSNGQLTDLGSLGGPQTFVTGINDEGEVVGYSDTSQLIPGTTTYASHAFVWFKGKMKDLGTFGGQNSRAYAINNQDVVVGSADTLIGTDAFAYSNGKMNDLTGGGDPGSGSVARVIDSSGEIFGNLYDSSGANYLFVVRSDGSVGEGYNTGANAIDVNTIAVNNMGLLIGVNTDHSGDIVSASGVSANLNTLIDPATIIPNIITNNGGTATGLPALPAMNNSGQIIARTSGEQGVLLTPAKTGSISGKVFYDTDANGVQNNGEIGLGGITVYQDVANTGAFAPGDPSTITDAAGQYTFANLAPGPYTIRFVAPGPNWRQIPETITLASGQNLTNRNFATLPLFGYSITDLGTLGGAQSIPVAINGAGQIVGNSETASGATHAFLYSPVTQKMTDLGTFGGADSSATGINSTGEIVGTADTTSKDPNGGPLSIAFVYLNGKLIELGTLDGQSSFATAVNDSGEVVGYYHQYQQGGGIYPPAVVDEPFKFSGGTGPIMEILQPGFAAYEAGLALTLDNAGDIAGYFYNPYSFGDYSEFTDINGVVTLFGYRSPGVLPSTASLGSNTTTQTQSVDLSEPLPSISGWALTNGVAINASGEIIGQGINPQGQAHAFVLTPVMASISGTLFNDLNGDGKQESLEGGLKGWQVYADVNGTGVYAAGDPTATTDASGHYSLTGLSAGGYVIRVVPKTGYRQTAPSSFSQTLVGAGASVTGPTFGEVAVGPYSGNPAAFGLIQAENFDLGGQGSAYNDPGNLNRGGLYRPAEGVGIGAIPTADGGGYFLGWTTPGETVNYTVSVAATGAYTLNFRVASAVSGGTFHLNVDGVNVTGKLTVPNTGDWNAYTIVSKTGVHLTAGVHVLQLAFDTKGADGGVGNFDWIQAIKTG
jgi:probable HAF family extracellular repeat protein